MKCKSVFSLISNKRQINRQINRRADFHLNPPIAMIQKWHMTEAKFAWNCIMICSSQAYICKCRYESMTRTSWIQYGHGVLTCRLLNGRNWLAASDRHLQLEWSKWKQFDAKLKHHFGFGHPQMMIVLPNSNWHQSFVEPKQRVLAFVVITIAYTIVLAWKTNAKYATQMAAFE